MQQFVDARVDFVPGERIQGKDFYEAFALWCEGESLRPLGRNTFSIMFTEKFRGKAERKLIGGRVYYLNVKLRNDFEGIS